MDRIEELMQALKPFADHSDDWADFPDDEILVEGWESGPAELPLAVKHLREAKRAYHSKERE